MFKFTSFTIEFIGIWIWWYRLKSIGVGLWRFILFNFCLILTTTHFPFHFLLLFSLKYFVSHRRGRTSAARLDPPQCLCPPFPAPINSLYCHFSSTLTKWQQPLKINYSGACPNYKMLAFAFKPLFCGCHWQRFSVRRMWCTHRQCLFLVAAMMSLLKKHFFVLPVIE